MFLRLTQLRSAESVGKIYGNNAKESIIWMWCDVLNGTPSGKRARVAVCARAIHISYRGRQQ